MRVGRRVSNAGIHYEKRYSIVTLAHNSIVKLMVQPKHERLGHAGAQTVLSSMNTLRTLLGNTSVRLRLVRFLTVKKCNRPYYV